MIITSSLDTHIKEVVDAVKNGDISIEMIDNAVRRIIACKYYYGIIE